MQRFSIDSLKLINERRTYEDLCTRNCLSVKIRKEVPAWSQKTKVIEINKIIENTYAHSVIASIFLQDLLNLDNLCSHNMVYM